MTNYRITGTEGYELSQFLALMYSTNNIRNMTGQKTLIMNNPITSTVLLKSSMKLHELERST